MNQAGYRSRFLQHFRQGLAHIAEHLKLIRRNAGWMSRDLTLEHEDVTSRDDSSNVIAGSPVPGTGFINRAIEYLCLLYCPVQAGPLRGHSVNEDVEPAHHVISIFLLLPVVWSENL